MNAKIRITVTTTPKIIPPTNEAPSNFLPLSGGVGVVCITGTIEAVGAVVELAMGACVALLGDILLAVEVLPGFSAAVAIGMAVVVEFESTA